MTPQTRTLRRLLRRPDLAAEIARRGDGLAITGTDGSVLLGQPGQGEGAAIAVGGETIGHVRGQGAAELAALLAFLAAQEAETRALARESLDRYKELAMLYSISEKTVGAGSRAEVAAIICDEAARFLKCCSVAALVLNAESGRLDLIANSGTALQERSSRDVGTDIVASVFRSGTGEIVNQTRADPRGLEGSGAPAAVIASPMKSGERVIGVLVAGSDDGREFTAGDLQILNAMAAHCAAAMEVLRLGSAVRARTRRPVDLIYGLDDVPPLRVSAMLGLQHVLIAVMSIAYPVLVALEAGGSRADAASVVAMSFVAMALVTALQAMRRGPVGSGYLAPYITSAIYLGPALLAARTGGLGLVFGMTVFAGIVSIALSQILRRFRRLFPPEISGVIVLMVGVSMVPVALSQLVGMGDGDRVSEPREWIVGLVTLATIVLVTVFAGRFRLYATTVGLGLGYLAAILLGLGEQQLFASVADLPVFGLPAPPATSLSFDAMLVVPFLAAALAANVKDAGLLISVQKINDSTWNRPDTASMSGGLVAGGIGNVAAGLIGGFGMSASGASVGLAAATGATARVIGLATAAIFLVLAFLPKVSALLALIPAPVMGAGLIYAACHLVSSGAELIASRMLDARRIYVVGLPLLAGVGIIAMPELAEAFPPWAAVIIGSPIATATILALLLNILLNVGVSQSASGAVVLDAGLGDQVARFVEKRGASWGARREVIDRVVPAITDWCEEFRDGSATSAEVTLSFDDFRFVATIRPDQPESSVPARVGALLDRRYDCRHRSTPDGGVRLIFEH